MRAPYYILGGAVADPGGRILRGHTPFFLLLQIFFLLFFLFTPEVGLAGGLPAPLPHHVNDEKKRKIRGENASRHLDSRPSLFTNPGSAIGDGRARPTPFCDSFTSWCKRSINHLLITDNNCCDQRHWNRDHS